MKNLVPAHERAWLGKTSEKARLLDSSGSDQEAPPGRGVFLAHSFTALLDETGVIYPTYQAKLNAVLEGFRALKYTVHCALEREDWGYKLMSPGPALQLDKDQVTKADYLMSFPQRSPGAFMELGFLLANPKPILLVNNSSLVEQDLPTCAEEQLLMRQIVGMLQSQGVPSTIIEDTSANTADFQATILPKIFEWIACH